MHSGFAQQVLGVVLPLQSCMPSPPHCKSPSGGPTTASLVLPASAALPCPAAGHPPPLAAPRRVDGVAPAVLLGWVSRAPSHRAMASRSPLDFRDKPGGDPRPTRQPDGYGFGSGISPVGPGPGHESWRRLWRVRQGAEQRRRGEKISDL